MNREIEVLKTCFKIRSWKVITTATAMAVGAAFLKGEIKLTNLQGDEGSYFVNPQYGQGVDRGDFSAVECITGQPTIEPPPFGKVTIINNADGSVDGFQQVDPKDSCFTPDHPKGANIAVFWVHDHNPKESPGFSVPMPSIPASKLRGILPNHARR